MAIFFYFTISVITFTNDVFILTWCVPTMCDQSCLGGSRLQRRYRVWCRWLTAWWVGYMMIPRHHRMIQHQLLMVYQEAQDVFSLVAQWDERMRSMLAGWGLLWLPIHKKEWVCVREDRLHEVPADRDQALTCHPHLTRWQGCHPVTVLWTI